MQVELSVRCGALKLSLGELRQLAPGMVLNIEGYDTGMAGLYYGDRPIGHGQLVEVEGRLGLQLSRISFSQ
ncbi:FliM/FliN family flagellar motor C-terminal domain-containing protein [Pseudomonas fragi]|uniref:FliM/FliN family flagellar motor C-terminal domain-containing protein n=1 Tax=Pseudomonas fragi TaxID=296 RepID=UPI0026AE5D61|nr:FliM/FliN family flagellar motor C-terminal domain-containing protein [Pseudomonas fragi]